MTAFGPELGDIVLATCQIGAKEASVALNRCLDTDIEVTPRAEFDTLADGSLPDFMATAGLIVRLEVGEAIALVLIPASGGLTADWLPTPDATGHAKLKDLGEQLGRVLLPADFPAEKSTSIYARDMSSICDALQVDRRACYIRFASVADVDGDDALWLIWPATGWAGEKVAPPKVEEREPKPLKKVAFEDFEDGVRQLPSYARNLLKIPMSATVTLASTKMPVSHIEELGPGSIIQFDKSCEDALTLEVGGCEIAAGEAVKIGEKFGFWITSVMMPEERFEAVKRT